MFTSSGTFTVPTGCKEIEVFLVGGGGGGCYIHGQGGGGGFTKSEKIYCNSGESVNISIGSKGQGYKYTICDASNGGNTIVNSVLASGGYCASVMASIIQTPNGGSGGGVSDAIQFNMYIGRNGGSDGSDGETCTQLDSGKFNGIGQGTTTRAFGESEGTLYAGGGGGCGVNYSGGQGGLGGGGNGGESNTSSGSSASVNTGGGGGGCNVFMNAGNGGSGIAIIRW